MKRHFGLGRLLLVAGAVTGLVAIGCASGFGSPAGATSLSPGEGSGTSWCGNYGGTNLGSYDNVYACELTSSSPDAGETPFNPGYPYFQCTELANRYLYNSNGDTEFDSSYNDDNLVGGNFVESVAAQYSIATGSSGGSDMPVAGDIISMWGGSSGQPESGDDGDRCLSRHHHHLEREGSVALSANLTPNLGVRA